jgi:redox-sensitive bicupin YhaK (pirin superfamily)
MSNLDPHPAVALVGGEAVDGPTRELLEGRDVVLGGTRAKGTEGLTVSRTLPNRDRRMVGAWCFVDHFGSAERDGSGPADGDGMQVAPHPHTGLQTVTWLIEGKVLHRDSLANTQLIRPGQLNLMTAGRAIAHAETSPAPGRLHGVQLWVALPDDARAVEPAFEHHEELPTVVDGAATVRVLTGELAGVTSPARAYSPLVGAEVSLAGEMTLPLNPDFEYAVLPLTGPVEVDGSVLERGPLLYLGRGRDDLRLAGSASLLLLGGEPFTERIVMWWNFIGRSHDEIAADREDWMAGRRFSPVVGYDGDPLPAPPLPTTPLLPRGRTR